MERGPQGYYIPNTTTRETFLAFVPNPLPPIPALQWDTNLYDLLERANRALGRLDVGAGLQGSFSSLSGYLQTRPYSQGKRI